MLLGPQVGEQAVERHRPGDDRDVPDDLAGVRRRAAARGAKACLKWTAPKDVADALADDGEPGVAGAGGQRRRRDGVGALDEPDSRLRFMASAAVRLPNSTALSMSAAARGSRVSCAPDRAAARVASSPALRGGASSLDRLDPERP